MPAIIGKPPFSIMYFNVGREESSLKVSSMTPFYGNIKIAPYEYFCAFIYRSFGQRFYVHEDILARLPPGPCPGRAPAQSSRPDPYAIIRAISTSLQLYPHSLSYQAKTFTKFPSITFVIDKSTIAE